MSHGFPSIQYIIKHLTEHSAETPDSHDRFFTDIINKYMSMGSHIWDTLTLHSYLAQMWLSDGPRNRKWHKSQKRSVFTKKRVSVRLGSVEYNLFFIVSRLNDLFFQERGVWSTLSPLPLYFTQNAWMLLYRRSWFPEDESCWLSWSPDLFSSATCWKTFLAFTGIPRYLLDCLGIKYSYSSILTLVIPQFFL